MLKAPLKGLIAERQLTCQGSLNEPFKQARLQPILLASDYSWTDQTVTPPDSTTAWPLTSPSTGPWPTTSPPRPQECLAEEPVKDYITRCDFNENLRPYCHWAQSCQSDEGEWIRTNGETPTKRTGPSRDSPAPWGDGQAGYYIYLEASNLVPGQSVRLESPALNVSGDVCVEFSYHMYGPLGDGGDARGAAGRRREGGAAVEPDPAPEPRLAAGGGHRPGPDRQEHPDHLQSSPRFV
ncbi:uncharacterized protein [Scyliorhinus torazame]|uniref:uncharacterized protein n=1 Tax=Scyliorhinus torazame TaxID=75743 RepID=UPI003B58FAC5